MKTKNMIFKMRRGHITNRSRKVYQYDLEGNLVKEHKSISMAAKDTGVRVQNIWKVCNGYNSTLGGFKFKYESI